MSWQLTNSASRRAHGWFRRQVWRDVFWIVVILVCVAATQLAHRSYESDLATNSDEAAHFVTAMCLLDYTRSALGSDPVSYAESYYVHYPKVAFGHWPPGFFGLQAVWYAVVGPSGQAGILLVGVIAAAAAFVLFRRLQRWYGTWIAVLSLAIYLSLPLVQRSSSQLMADMPASLFCFLAVLAFCDASISDDRRQWMAMTFWLAMAVLTKESALSLLVFVPIATLSLDRNTGGRSPSRWYVLCALVPLSLALLAAYMVSGVLRARGLPSITDLPPLRLRLEFLSVFFGAAPRSLFVLAAAGAFISAIPLKSRRLEVAPYVRATVVWLAVWLVCQVLVRDGIELRYFLPAVFPLVILSANALDWLSRVLPPFASRFVGSTAASFARLAVPGAIAAACVLSIGHVHENQRSGYAMVAEILARPTVGQTVLISSDPQGEGAFIVEALLRDPARDGIVLRASKMLASSTWMGGDYQLITRSSSDIRDLLDTIPVRFIVLDSNGLIDAGTSPHHRLLANTIAERPSEFRLVASLPLWLNGHRQDDAIQIYENLSAAGRLPNMIRIPAGSTFRHDLQLNVRDWRSLPLKPTGGMDRAQPGDRIRSLAALVRAIMPICFND